MMDDSMLQEGASRCEALMRLLEQDQEELGAYLQGELLEEYRKLVDLEIRKLGEVTRQLKTMA